MRVYVPGTLPLLRAWYAERSVVPAGIAHTLTPALREWFAEADTEELEYAAMVSAGEDSLRLLAGEDAAPRRRVVIAVDASLAITDVGPGLPASAVRLPGPLGWASVASVHIDEPDSEPVIRAAAAAIRAADAGDEQAQLVVDEAEACDLLWFDVSEVAAVVADADSPHPSG
ncbi:MAG: hypothetical protein CSA58_08965 [Micrococcales bacterium]|nr:MAG: hypothetical protein CSB46_09165 [Micrococcales bacterium]PIE26545.1 MAG: hypothetical protein CSA58_08965 [Micrococcales bacterium]